MTSSAPLFAGQTVLITGASRGLGAELAKAFGNAGANLILVARDVTAMQTVAEGLSPSVQYVALDLSRASQVESLARDLAGTPVDVLINNAAIQGPIGPLEGNDLSQWRRVFDINLFAPVTLSQAVMPAMRKKGRGKIINLSGGGSASPRPDFSAYGTSKAALVRFSETLAVELAGTGIDVNCIAPGPMNTGMLDELLAAGPNSAKREYDKALRQQREGGTPFSKAVDLAMFLASAQSNGITGKLISAVWDPIDQLPAHKDELASSDIYTLRRITPEDRGKKW